MGRTSTGKLTENRVIQRLQSCGLAAYKPVPDRGIDIITYFPASPDRVVNIQVKGRNPKKDPNLRWFQVRVSPKLLEETCQKGIDPNQSWISKINKVDFFILDAIRVNEMWVFPTDKVFEIINLNESKYGSRPDNIFHCTPPYKQKQKEMNLDIVVDGQELTKKFNYYLNNFDLIVKRLS